MLIGSWWVTGFAEVTGLLVVDDGDAGTIGLLACDGGVVGTADSGNTFVCAVCLVGALAVVLSAACLFDCDGGTEVLGGVWVFALGGDPVTGVNRPLGPFLKVCD